jgi:hypothetical protein
MEAESTLTLDLLATILLRMARRGRANKSLIKQRYHVAKVAFPDDADLARSLGVHRSAVVRWKRGEAPAARNWEQLVGLDTVVSLLEGFLDLSSIPKWLRGINAHLGDRRPIDVIRQGRLSEVVAAIEAEKAGAFA